MMMKMMATEVQHLKLYSVFFVIDSASKEAILYILLNAYIDLISK